MKLLALCGITFEACPNPHDKLVSPSNVTLQNLIDRTTLLFRVTKNKEYKRFVITVTIMRAIEHCISKILNWEAMRPVLHGYNEES